MDAVLAVNNFGDTRSGGLAGPMGLFVILLLVIGTVLLIRNMNARLRRLPDSFEDRPDARGGTAETSDDPAAGGGTTPDGAGAGPAATGPAPGPGGADAEVTARPPADPPPGGPPRA